MSVVPLVSTVVAAHNAAAYLPSTLDSILNQTLTDQEIILVDDGSTDGSGQYLQQVRLTDSRIRVFRQDQGGVAKARNLGLAHARGRYLAVVDADDLSLPDRLARQVDFLEKRPDVAVVGSSMWIMDQQGKLTGKRHTYPTDSRRVARRLLRHCCIAHPTAMIRMDAIRSVGGYRPLFTTGSDYDLWLRINDRWPCANLPDVLVHYRYHDQSISVAKPDPLIGVLSSLAAAYGARFRRRHGHDPLDHQPVLTRELLVHIGVSPEMIDLNLARTCLSKAVRLAKFRNDEGVDAWLQTYRQLDLSPSIRRWLRTDELRVARWMADNGWQRWLLFGQQCACWPERCCRQWSALRRGVYRW